MTTMAQLDLFAGSSATAREVVLTDGPWGRSWLGGEGVISPRNPLFFTCQLCGRTSGSYDAKPRVHEAGCSHPAARAEV